MLSCLNLKIITLSFDNDFVNYEFIVFLNNLDKVFEFKARIMGLHFQFWDLNCYKDG